MTYFVKSNIFANCKVTAGSRSNEDQPDKPYDGARIIPSSSAFGGKKAEHKGHDPTKGTWGRWVQRKNRAKIRGLLVFVCLVSEVLKGFPSKNGRAIFQYD